MTNRNSEIERFNSGNAILEYLDHFQNDVPVKPVDALVLALVPNRSWPAIAAIFDNRAASSTVWDWRVGRAKMPQWAALLLAEKTAAAAARQYHNARHMLRASIYQGPKTGPAIRARLVRLAEQKEKAGG